MFDISPEKFLLVMTIALAVLGPERIPQVARALGKARTEIRRLTSEVHPDALQVLSNPRGALLNAVAEPTQIISDAVAQPRLAVTDAIADLQFPRPPTAGPIDDSVPAASADTTPNTTPDDPGLN